jgi:hypothetical protein
VNLLTARPCGRPPHWAGRTLTEPISPAPHELTMTPKAEEAFADYVAQERPRSLERLAAERVRRGLGKSSEGQKRTLEKWSAQFGWQERIRRLAEAKLNEANETRADIYLRAIREYDRRTRNEMIAAMKLHDIHGVHDRVKFPDPQRNIIEGDPDSPVFFQFIRDDKAAE